MRAWVVEHPGPVGTRPLRPVECPDPEPGPGEVRVRVRACGVCRTDLHLAEGDLPPRRPRTVPGHEVVGVVDALGPGAQRLTVGERIGIAWLRGTCGAVPVVPHRPGEPVHPSVLHRLGHRRWLRRARRRPRGVRLPVARRPRRRGDRAPAVCRNRRLPRPAACRAPGRRPAGHLRLRRVRARRRPGGDRAGRHGARADAVGAERRRWRCDLGAASAGPADAAPPEPLDAAVLFAPAGELVPVALRALDQGGTLAVAGIHLSDVPAPGLRRRAVPARSSCAASPRTPARTARSSCGSPMPCTCGPGSTRGRSPKPTGHSPTSPRVASPAPRSSSREGPVRPRSGDPDCRSLGRGARAFPAEQVRCRVRGRGRRGGLGRGIRSAQQLDCEFVTDRVEDRVEFCRDLVHFHLTGDAGRAQWDTENRGTYLHNRGRHGSGERRSPRANATVAELSTPHIRCDRTVTNAAGDPASSSCGRPEDVMKNAPNADLGNTSNSVHIRHTRSRSIAAFSSDRPDVAISLRDRVSPGHSHET